MGFLDLAILQRIFASRQQRQELAGIQGLNEDGPSPETNDGLTAADLPVVQYLNQRLVFDLLAVLEDGFSNFKTVENQAAGTDAKESTVEGGLGVGHSFALLSLAVAGSSTRNKETSRREITTEERVHTPSSLFARLRSELKSRNLVKEVEGVDDLDKVDSGQFVEFRATLQRSQVIDMMEAYLMLAPTLGNVVENQSTGNSRSRGRSGRRASQRTEADSTIELVNSMKSVLADTDAADLVATVGVMRFVLTVEQSYFNDPSMNEVLDGDFRVFGKVTRKLSSDSETIQLFRRSPLGKFGGFNTALDEMNNQVSSAEFQGGVPDASIAGPALQIIPIAIFV